MQGEPRGSVRLGDGSATGSPSRFGGPGLESNQAYAVLHHRRVSRSPTGPRRNSSDHAGVSTARMPLSLMLPRRSNRRWLRLVRRARA